MTPSTCYTEHLSLKIGALIASPAHPLMSNGNHHQSTDSCKKKKGGHLHQNKQPINTSNKAQQPIKNQLQQPFVYFYCTGLSTATMVFQKTIMDFWRSCPENPHSIPNPHHLLQNASGWTKPNKIRGNSFNWINRHVQGQATDSASNSTETEL